MKSQIDVTEVEYFCETCNIKFAVLHGQNGRNSHCSYCNTTVKETGLVRKVVNDEIITYENDIEISRKQSRRSSHLNDT